MPEGARQARSVRTREQLLDAVAQDVARHGYAGTNVEHVADRLRLTKGAFYGHFPSKAAVAEELCRRFESALAEACAGAADRPGSPALRLRRLADAVASAIASSVQVEAGLRITLDKARAERAAAPALVELRERFAAAFRACAEQGAHARKPGRGGSDPDQAASLVLLSVLLGTEAMAWGGEADRTRLVALLASLCTALEPDGD
jgi:AcrR family transcriptional regulator